LPRIECRSFSLAAKFDNILQVRARTVASHKKLFIGHILHQISAGESLASFSSQVLSISEIWSIAQSGAMGQPVETFMENSANMMQFRQNGNSIK
jgi:hypothetical protein